MGKLLAATLVLMCVAGCKTHPSADFKPLDQAGMWYENIQELRGLDVNDAEVAELARLKQTGAADATCVELVKAAHAHNHPFASADAVLSLGRAGFTEADILEFARMDELDSKSGEAVTLKFTGISTDGVVEVMQRRMKGLPTMSNLEISKLKNTGLTEKQILEQINRGMTDAEAEREVTARRHAANQTGFVRNRGRRSR
ncbi:MAG: hypothetical protein ABSF92_03985 [Candidatus Acidiferrales bacterium]|jgi:hypothetical protein